MRSALTLAGSVFIYSAAAHAAEPPVLPDPIMTPGAVDPAATRDVICNSTTRERRHVTTAAKRAVLAAYNIPGAESASYEIDHLIPLAIGGANVVANLWPQPWAEADQKDVLEVELQRRVCLGLLDQAQAQREIADDWTVAYTRYVGGVPVAVPSYEAPTRATFGEALGLRDKVKARLLRWARRMLLGDR